MSLVNVISNSPSQDYTHPDDHTSLNYDMTPGFNPLQFYYYSMPVCLVPTEGNVLLNADHTLVKLADFGSAGVITVSKCVL